VVPDGVPPRDGGTGAVVILNLGGTWMSYVRDLVTNDSDGEFMIDNFMEPTFCHSLDFKTHPPGSCRMTTSVGQIIKSPFHT